MHFIESSTLQDIQLKVSIEKIWIEMYVYILAITVSQAMTDEMYWKHTDIYFINYKDKITSNT